MVRRFAFNRSLLQRAANAPFRARRLLLAVLGCAGLASAATITPVEQGWDIKAKTYSAHVNAKGALVSLKMGQTELLGEDPKTKLTGAPFPGEAPPTSVNLRDQIIAAKNDTARIEYTFTDTSIGVETEGAPWSCHMTAPVRAYVLKDGTIRSNAARSVGNIQRLVVGDAAIEFSEPFHHVAGRLVNSAIPSGRKKPVEKMTFTIELGLSADTTTLIEVRSLRAEGNDEKLAPTYAKGESASYTMELANLGASDITVPLSYTLGTHFAGGKVSEPVTLAPLLVPAGGKAEARFAVSVSEPGCYWLNLDVGDRDRALKRERRFFVYAPDDYRPPLTRPDDFGAFWQDQLKRLRAEAMDVALKPVEARSSEAATFYTLQLTVRGQRYEADLSVPKTPGRRLAILGGKIAEKATDAEQIQLSLPHQRWPEQATFNRWASASDNNLLDCYLLAVRLTDYLRSREDVERIYLIGASRQGPIQLVNASLDPTKVVAVESHVPTSLGVSWTDPVYKGWGNTPTPPAMAAYVDPVNFAPDLRVPHIIDLGAYDGLSPVPGGLAFHNHAKQSPWRRFSIELGGHGYFTSAFKKTAKAELAERLKQNTSAETDERILKDH